MNRRSITLLDRCRALIARAPGVALVLGLALAVFTTQLALQAHATQHELLPGVQQVCEQCVTAENSAPPPTVAPSLPPVVVSFDPILASHALPPSCAPLVVRNRAPPVLA